MGLSDLLKQAGLNKTEFGDLLGLGKGTVSSWSDEPPRYAIAYLELMIENKECRQAKAWFKRYLDL